MTNYNITFKKNSEGKFIVLNRRESDDIDKEVMPEYIKFLENELLRLKPDSAALQVQYSTEPEPISEPEVVKPKMIVKQPPKKQFPTTPPIGDQRPDFITKKPERKKVDCPFCGEKVYVDELERVHIPVCPNKDGEMRLGPNK